MRGAARVYTVVGAAAVLLLAPATVAPGTVAGAGEYIVVFRPDAGDVSPPAGVRVRYRYRSALSGFAAALTPAAVARLRQDPRVASIAPDRRLETTGFTIPEGVYRVDAPRSATAAIDGQRPPQFSVNVAVLDTGIDTRHPDLNVVGGKNCSTERTYIDHYGHGTHAAGIIGAYDDARGVVGVAPGVRLWAVKVLDDDASGSLADMLCGVDWVTSTRTDSDPANNIDVANVSLGGPGSDDGACGSMNGDALHAAICRAVAAGVTYVAAAGNTASDAAGDVPAAYDEVITVSALADSDGRPGGLGPPPACRPDERVDAFASFSNFGPDVDIIAPGVCILSTLPLRADGRPDYGELSGTSFAAPHVSGAAALYLARHPGASPAEVRRALLATGSSDWDNRNDPDGIKEPRVDVASF